MPTNTQNNIENISNYYLVTAEPHFISKTFNHMQQTTPLKVKNVTSCHLLPTCSTLIKSVTVSESVAVSKMWVVLHQAWSESRWRVKCEYLEQMLAVIKNDADDQSFQQVSAPAHCACNRDYSCYSAKFSISFFISFQQLRAKPHWEQDLESLIDRLILT